MERGSRTKLIAGLVLGVVFGSGLLLGYAADRGFVADTASRPAEVTTDERDGQQPRERRPLVYEQLNPTPAQTTVIDSILRVHRERMNKLDREYRDARHHYQASYEAVVQETREAIAGVFPPDVAEEYRRLLAEFDRRRERAAAAPDDRN
jgi:hypothetical protein